ncbi:MAG: hypothetical protein AB7S26_24415 [Sandaracinaceae bacterium]
MRGQRSALMRSIAVATATLGLGVGCADVDTDVENPEHVSAWANTVSAFAAFIPASEPLSFAAGRAPFADPACPTTSDDGTTAEITGGCTNSEGREYVGSATVVRDGDDMTVTLDGYGSSTDDFLAPVTGTYMIAAVGANEHTFDAHVTQEGGATVTTTYAGRVTGTWDAPTTWTGAGTFTRDSFLAPRGTVTATTTDQVRDNDVCSSESASGSTTFVFEGRSVTVDYNGATSCDDDATAEFSVDGVDQGAVAGVTCAASPMRGGAPGPIALVASVGIAILARRRRSMR